MAGGSRCKPSYMIDRSSSNENQTVCRTNDVSWSSDDQHMLDAFNDAVIITSDVGTITGVNTKAIDLFGFTM